MAKTTVEILGGELDGTVLNNIASEATMRELLAAIKSESKSPGGGGGGGSSKTKNPAKNLDVMSKLANGLGNQIGNVIGAVGSMGAMLLTGNTKMSSYTKTLNDQVIAKLPIVGGLLGGLGGIISDSIEVFEDWNESLKTGTQTGATFGNSILRASKAATDAAMDIDSYMKMISSNSSVMLNLGKTVTEGAERFSKISRLLNRDGGKATQTLRQMGMNARNVNEGLISYIDIMGGGLLRDKRSDADVADSYEKFQLNIMRLTSLTGKSVKKLEEEMAVATKDVVFKMALQKLDEKERSKLLNTLANYTAMYGQSGAELFKSLYLQRPPGDEGARNLMVLQPQLVRSMKDSINTALDTNVTIDKMSSRIEDDIISVMLKSAKSTSGLEGLLAAAGASYGDAKSLTAAINPILNQLVKYGDVSKLTEKDLRAMFKKARDEQKARDEITKFLNDFEMAMQDLKFQLMDFLYPLLDDLGKVLERQDLPGKVKAFGNWIKDSVEKYLPDVITFFKYLGDENGRDFIWNEVTYFFERMGINFMYHAKTMFDKDRMGDFAVDRDNALAKALEDHEQRQNILRPKLPERYTPQSERGAAVPNKSGRASSVTETGKKDQGVVAASDKIVAELKDKLAIFNPVGKGSSLAINSEFGNIRQYRDADGNVMRESVHPGVDVKADKAKIRAGIDGKVSYGYESGYGYYAKILCADGVELLYGHLHQTDTQDQFTRKLHGGTVTAGTEIGISGGGKGDPGAGTSTGRHLHLEARRNGVKFDPTSLIKPGMSTGTLGTYGSLFKDFGSATDVMLEGTKAVMTPEQMNNVMTGAGNMATKELLESIDVNFARLEMLMRERTNLSRSQLSYIENNQMTIA